LAAHAVVTPYLDYDYVHAKLGGFTEDGLEGADLKIEGGSSSHSFMTAGARWATKIGRLVPQLDLGYRYRFGSGRSSFEARFNDASAATDGSFDVASAAQKKGSFLAGLSVGGMVGPVDVRIGYEGEFGRGLSSHSGSFKLVLPLGGHSAPPAARRQ
jgi:uncharacterized protein with beta-barrel porin domain